MRAVAEGQEHVVAGCMMVKVIPHSGSAIAYAGVGQVRAEGENPMIRVPATDLELLNKMEIAREFTCKGGSRGDNRLSSLCGKR